ncbi:MAG: VacB/RNase II family 3'-5' exoribonuclease, partial [bacterium]|nr:VacB/RNase II family 3'-5' exoribonuclease [bacterium]
MRKNPKKHKSNEEKVVCGVISITSKGAGYVAVPDFQDDIFIDVPHTKTAFNKDEVEVVLFPAREQFKTRAGKVVKIVKRFKERFVGTLKKENGRTFLVPDDYKIHKDFLILDAPKEAEENLKTLVRLTKYEEGENPEATIIKIIGRRGEHRAEMESILLGKGFETGFPPQTEEEAEKIGKQEKPIKEEEIKTRRDFRGVTTFTIDPKTAKDFDDAISLREIASSKVPAQKSEIKNPTYEIGIHIADVSHYVKEDSALDKEARERAFSVYLVDRTIPMLPEVLSNDLCSLNPKEARLAFSAVFEIDGNGHVLSRWFGRTVIYSDKRFTYEEAQDVLDKKEGEFFKELRVLNDIAHKLKEEKFRQGAIDFETEEFEFELDSEGKPLKIFKKKRLDTHKLVEEFMLLANREVAEFFWQASIKSDKSGKKESPFLYRIHDVPNAEKIGELAVFVRALGHELSISKSGEVTGKDLQALFRQIEGTPNESLIKTAAVRSMAKAIYSTANIGHFGLSFEYYTHFTSPIRRYPDLLVHRMLDRILKNRKVGPDEFVRLEKIAKRSTEKEIAASEAERESRKLKQVEYMSDKIGREF